ncbi:MAG: DNA alkylation repair protein [Lachnospiraceae bacterium]|nr:DNA alkylation repair protein [Lachnospiraceae bacterium]
MNEIQAELFRLQDLKYREFQSKLIPGLREDEMIGVRTPALRKYARELSKQEGVEEFLKDLPHLYFDENQLQAFLISAIKDYDQCIDAVNAFLPYVNNWATCDQLSPQVFKKHKRELLSQVEMWIESEETYTIRFGIGMLMQHYLDEDFCGDYPRMVSEICSDEYYVNMMVAWYFATALAKQYDEVLPYIETGKLQRWTHNKTIQKAIESYRIRPEQKAYLKSLRIK